ncbi:MAG: DUF4865 family protein [Demequina sp.]
MTWVIDVPLAMDMNAVRNTAASTGEALSQTAGLLAGVTAVSTAGFDEATRNSIAMLTIWANTSRMAEFLWGDATARIEQHLARPSARMWTVGSIQLERPRFPAITHVGLWVRPRMSWEPIGAVVEMQRQAAAKSLAGRSTALACRGLDPNTWEDVSIDAWQGRPRRYDGQVFNVVRAVLPERP